jgi:malonate decarboxylase beta subunit
MNDWTALRPRDPLRGGTPRARLHALADAGSVEWLDAPRASPHLARFGIAPQDDDGVATARLCIRGRTWLAAAQDERFLRGSVGAAHGNALRELFERACAERPDGVLLLAASGGVRLHEANAAELALGRALRALIDARASDIATAAIATGDVFGGASVLACAAERFAAVPGIRIGLSGPKVVEVARGRDELDAQDAAAVETLYGAEARARGDAVEAIAPRVDDAVAWITASRGVVSFEQAVRARQRALARSLSAAAARLPQGWNAEHVASRLWRCERAWIVAPWGEQPVDAASLAALDEALLTHVADGAPRVLLLLEDSPGHDVSRAAEAQFLSRSLAHHACVLGLLRARGVRIAGAVLGIAHSAAFFANALQADVLYAAPGARVVAMAPDAIARVTGVSAASLIEDDALLGHPVRHFAAVGGVDAVLTDGAPATVLAALTASA